MHGPPGTGKSQTIVNIIADALAHRRTVLMVCQKYAATRIVFEKLKQVGLDGLRLEVADPEQNRKAIYKAIREQVKSLPMQYPAELSGRRARIASELACLESELDEYARAVHEPVKAIGLNYRQMKAIEGETYARFDSVRALPAIEPIVAQMSSLQLESVCREIESAGSTFGVAKPRTNPWRFRRLMLQVTSTLKPDVLGIIDALRVCDDEHMRRITTSDAGVAITGDIEGFRDTANRLVQLLRDIREQPQSSRVRVLRAWIREMRRASPDEIRLKSDACERL